MFNMGRVKAGKRKRKVSYPAEVSCVGRLKTENYGAVDCDCRCYIRICIAIVGRQVCNCM